MSVTKEITRLEKSNVKLSVTVPKEDVRQQYNDLLKEYSKSVLIPGFRKGHVPQNVLERKFGDSLKGEALSKIIEKAVSEIFEDENLPRDERPLPYSQPSLEDEPKLDFDQDLCFSLVYDVLPAVNISQWKGLEIEIPEAEITEENIARELEDIRDRNAFVLDREDGAEARDGDIVTITHSELDENGEPLPNGTREDFAFTLGKGQNAYDFDSDIIGMKKGETREFTKTYPESEDKEAFFAGKTLKLRVTLNALKEKKLPDLDDDLAQDVDEKFKTLDDLKNSIRERLEKNAAEQMRKLKVNGLLEKIMENTPIILPESMVQAELDGRIRNLAQRFGTDTDKIMEMLAQQEGGMDDIQKNWRPTAEKALHSRLIVETLMEENHIEATDDDVKLEMEQFAAATGELAEDMGGSYGMGRIREIISDNIKERRLFDLLLAENTVKTGKKINYLDFLAING